MSIQLTVAQAAVLLDVSNSTVLSMIHRHIIPATAINSYTGHKKGRARYKISLDDLTATGLHIHLDRLSVVAEMERKAKGILPKESAQPDMTAMIQPLLEELENARTEVRDALQRLQAIEARVSILITGGHAADMVPTRSDSWAHAGATRIRGVREFKAPPRSSEPLLQIVSSRLPEVSREMLEDIYYCYVTRKLPRREILPHMRRGARHYKAIRAVCDCLDEFESVQLARLKV